MIEGNHVFCAEYSKRGKPTGKRTIEIFSNSFEEALYQFMLPNLCEKVHGHDFWRDVLGEKDIICHKKNNITSLYSVIFKKGDNNIICEYIVEMEIIATRREKFPD